MKKILGSLAASAVLFMFAGQVLAANGSGNVFYSSGNAMMQTGTASSGQMQAYMAKLQQGTLTPAEQQDMYKIMDTPLQMMGTATLAAPAGQGNFNYRVMAMHDFDNAGAWYGLMFIFTVALVWAALLLLIALMWKLIVKHRKS